ncbi:hypothetical protein JTE90_019476 [Oedothorax gibbosus]|uniref:Uncharacterized protein n=1 Tax=Oedothorax gibbosus TaxID=931172 RepID=A0AAV6TL78_9ARAC|nr:hypothetical protein JTE90_019476 [Oedothorax gibbosus]
MKITHLESQQACIKCITQKRGEDDGHRGGSVRPVLAPIQIFGMLIYFNPDSVLPQRDEDFPRISRRPFLCCHWLSMATRSSTRWSTAS